MPRVTMTGAKGAASYGATQKSPCGKCRRGSFVWRLTMTYFHMGRPHTIIGAERFHY